MKLLPVNIIIKKFLIIFLVINFFGCALSVGTVSAQTESSGHGCAQSENNNFFNLDNHHLLSQPQPNEILDLVLPEISFILNSIELTDYYLNSAEIINNQGAPPLFEPLKTGIVNTKTW